MKTSQSNACPSLFRLQKKPTDLAILSLEQLSFPASQEPAVDTRLGEVLQEQEKTIYELRGCCSKPVKIVHARLSKHKTKKRAPLHQARIDKVRYAQAMFMRIFRVGWKHVGARRL